MNFLRKIIKEFREEDKERLEERLLMVNSRVFWFCMDWVFPLLTAFIVSLLFNYFLRK